MTEVAPWLLDDAVRNARILIVDDLPANVMLLTRMLCGVGFLDVTSTLDPTTVCTMHARDRYDLIILDLQMPNMSGFEVMAGLRLAETGDRVPVLVITAEPGQSERALRAGARDFITKPFGIGEVLMRIQNLLEVRLLQMEVRRQNAELMARSCDTPS